MTGVAERVGLSALDLDADRLDRQPLATIEAYIDQASDAVPSTPAEAVDALGALREAATRRGSFDLAGRCDYVAARGAVSLGWLDTALELIERARSQFLATGCEFDAARTDLGRMHVLDDLGRHDEAIAVGRELLARTPQLALVGEGDSSLGRLEAAASENLGVSHGYLGHHHEAILAYDVATERYEALGLHDDAIRCRANRGVEQVELGDLDGALDALKSARPEFVLSGELLSAALCAAYEAGAHLQQGNYLQALRCTSESEALLSGQETTTEYARVQLVRARTLSSLNLVDEALALCSELEARFEAVGLVHDRATALLSRASLLLRLGRVTDAVAGFEGAASLFDAVGDVAMRAVADIGLSYSPDRPDAAGIVAGAADHLAHLGRRPDEVAALLRLVELSPPDDAGEILARCEQLMEGERLPHLEWQVLRERARLHRRAGDLDGSAAALDQAAEVVEDLRLTIADERGRIPFLGTRRGVSEDRIELLLARGDVRRAYELTVAARARTLSERTDIAPSPEARGVPAPTDGEIELTFEIVGDEVLAFVRTADELSVVRGVTTVHTVRRLVERLDAHWRRFTDRGLVARHEHALVTATIDVMQQLHLELLAKIPAVFDASLVTVVPAGPLVNVPFAALHDGVCHLIERCPIGLAASVPVATRAAERRRTGERTLLVGLADHATPRVADEVSAIASWRPGSTVLTGQDATADDVILNIAEHDIVHIACHGINRRDNPELSALQLGDRSLTALEIADLELSGQLVVLSACSSGRQHSTGNADEAVGLPRAFLAAGASDVVVNLWQADDLAALELMTDLHTRLDAQPPAMALREAQLALLSRRPHPYLWAPSVAYAGLHRSAPCPREGDAS